MAWGVKESTCAHALKTREWGTCSKVHSYSITFKAEVSTSHSCSVTLKQSIFLYNFFAVTPTFKDLLQHQVKKSLGGFVAAQHVGWSAADVTTLFYSRHYLTVSPIWQVESFISDI